MRDTLTTDTLEAMRLSRARGAASARYRMRYAHGIGTFGPSLADLDTTGVVSVVIGDALAILHTLEAGDGIARRDVRVLEVERLAL